MRALLYDPQRRELLLIKAVVPDTGVELWFTPGGGKEDGETDLQALAREVREETGLAALPPVHPVWLRREQFVFMGDEYDQSERYFLAPVPRFELVQTGLESHEQETFLAARWWSLEAIVDSAESFVPADLGRLMMVLDEQLAAGELPGQLIRVGR